MSALNNVEAVSQDKPIWITEAGWPVSGPAENQAVASIDNSKTYWDELGCELFNKYNVWWYILRDNNGSPAPDPSFGIVGLELEEPLFDLTCPAGSSGASAVDRLITMWPVRYCWTNLRDGSSVASPESPSRLFWSAWMIRTHTSSASCCAKP